MSSLKNFDIPVLFILFNRPELAQLVLDRIRLVRPAVLYIAIDGPRPTIDDDENSVQQCISLIDKVDWPCTVKTLIRDHNLGCKIAVSSAIDWFFREQEMGIILEDDCLPDITFFYYCENLLHKYKDDYRVMHVSGCNLISERRFGNDSFFFTNVTHVWGWATWKRAWSLYDIGMKDYAAFSKNKGLKRIVKNKGSIAYWKEAFDFTYCGKINTWDYQWVFSIWSNGGLSVIPNQNLISNIGFGAGATHTIQESEQAYLPTRSIDTLNLKYPNKIKINEEADEYIMSKIYSLPPYILRKYRSICLRLKNCVLSLRR